MQCEKRRSGNADNPRILGAFNEATPDWISFLMFTFFTDRDGKYQLASLAESAFDPLSRTCRFSSTEEAHHHVRRRDRNWPSSGSAPAS